MAWGFKCERIIKLQKKAIRAITNSKYNAHTEPLLKELKLLSVPDIFKKQCLKLYHKWSNLKLPFYLASMFIKIRDVHDHDTRQRNILFDTLTQHVQTKNCIRHFIPTLLSDMPQCITEKFETHSLDGFSLYVKRYMLDRYICTCAIHNCYICDN